MDSIADQRETGETGKNAVSSRSQLVTTLVIRDSKERVGKFTFIDLAGSEGFNDAKTDQQQKASVLDMHERQRDLCNDDD